MENHSIVDLRKGAIMRPTVKPGARSADWDFRAMYEADALERVNAVKAGLAATAVEEFAQSMDLSKERLMNMLGLARATIDRKVRERKPLSSDESSRVLGVARLVGQIQRMVDESGNPDGFDAAPWVAWWLEQPLAAMGGRCPAELMDTPEGQAYVAQIASRIESGAFS